MLRVLVVLGIAIGSAPAHAQFFSGNNMFAACMKSRPIINGYVAGAVDKSDFDGKIVTGLYETAFNPTVSKEQSEKTFGRWMKEVKKISGYCLPPGVTVGQMSDVFCKFLAENPAERHRSGGELVNTAMMRAWPCKDE